MRVEESVFVPAPPAAVWDVVGDVGGIGRWIPGVAAVAVEGDVRRVTFTNGAVASERILSVDDAARTCTYAYVTGPLPLERYEARLAVVAAEGGSRVRWNADFAGYSPAEDDRLRAIISGAYRRALERLVGLHRTGPGQD